MKKNKVIFLSHYINERTPTYGNRDKFLVEDVSKISDGKSANSSKWIFSSNHLGTHIDLPKHFYDNGSALNDFLPEYWLFSKIALVNISVKEDEIIEDETLFENVNNDIDLLLIKTGFEQFRGEMKYWKHNPGFSPDMADFFRNKFKYLRAIGFDFISLTSFGHRDIGKEAHLAFLDEDKGAILIIEDMKLQNLKKEPSKVYISPLLIENANGSPVTIIAEYF